jgi:chromatin segregation and condensation protein Rec8/ScpA/Scc1 (kleisin family)
MRYAEMDVIISEINPYDMNKTMSKRLSRLPVTRNNYFFLDQYQQEYNSVEKERRNKSVTEEQILLVPGMSPV